MPEKSKPKTAVAAPEKPAASSPATAKATRVNATTKVAPIIPSDKAPKPEKQKKPKMVRDSFTMPQEDYAHIASLKERCIKSGVNVKKSELLRIALANLSKLSDKALLAAVSKIETIKTGRPAKS